MEGYILDYDVLSLETDSYYSIPGFTRKDRSAGSGYATPYYIEGEFADNHTFTGIIRVPLDEDLHLSDELDVLPDQFTYYLEISDIYGELLQYEKEQLLLPAGAPESDYITVICDADGKPLDSQGSNAELYSTYRRNTDTVSVYVCDYGKYMNELKGDVKKIADDALFGTEVHFQ